MGEIATLRGGVLGAPAMQKPPLLSEVELCYTTGEDGIGRLTQNGLLSLGLNEDMPTTDKPLVDDERNMPIYEVATDLEPTRRVRNVCRLAGIKL